MYTTSRLFRREDADVKPQQTASIRVEAELSRPTSDTTAEYGTTVHDVARLMRVAFDRRIRSLGLTRSQWWVVGSLLRIDGPTQTEMAAYLHMERAPLGKIVDKLEANGWVVRRADPNDKRVNRVFLTNKIEPFVPTLVLASCNTFEDATDGLDDARRLDLLAALKGMKRNLARALGDPLEQRVKGGTD
jgi:MarR family transcriptional regulator for hemolysin